MTEERHCRRCEAKEWLYVADRIGAKQFGETIAEFDTVINGAEKWYLRRLETMRRRIEAVQILQVIR